MKYLTNSGLSYFLNKIKAYIASQLNSKASAIHTHTKSDIIDLPNGYVVDSALSSSSENAVQNKVVKNALDGKSNTGHTHTKSEITDFPSLATVATSGSYNDLSNKPTIPTVNNATLKIQKNGTDVKTFTANASTDVTCNISVPTKTSDLTNDSGFLTSHQSLSNYSTLANTVKSISISGKTITVTPGSGSAYTLTTQDTVYTHPTSSGNKHIPSGGSSGQFLGWSADGTAKWVNNPNSDTKNTAGSTDTSSKIFLIGATSQTANPQTYSHDTAYVGTDGCLYSGGTKVLTAHQSLSNYSTLANTIKSLSISGKTITYTKGDNTTGTLTTQDTNTTYSNFVKSGSGAKAGLVPAPSTTAGTTKYLREDGTWQVPPDHTYTVNNATLTIQKNGSNVATFTANASSNATANITVPTKVSQLTNDSGFLTSADRLPVGSYIQFAGSQAPAGFLVCNGGAISRTTYSALFAVIGTTYGSGDGSTTFNLPNLTDRFLQGSTTSGTVKNAGLPNITGEAYLITTQTGYNTVHYCNGAFSTTEEYVTGYGNKRDIVTEGTHDYYSSPIWLNASRSSSIYGNSATVQPPALTCLICIKY